MQKTIWLLILLFFGLVLSIILRKKTPAKKSEKRIQQRIIESVSNELEQEVFVRLEVALKKAGFDDFPSEMLLLAFKEEQKLQVYAKREGELKFIKQYALTASSGNLGPKLQEGDRQIPEGIYQIEYLNPNSSYHLSLKVNYPNEFDKSKTRFENVKEMGGDIFIHGKATTIGCIPIGDEAIEEVFLMAAKAFHHPIKVIISPRDFRKGKKYPSIASVDWEEELYNQVEVELAKIPVP